MRLEYPNNSLICFLSTNSLRNKIIDTREVIEKISPDFFVIAEPKHSTNEFHSNQF